MSKYLLIETTYNWADEMDCPSFALMKKKEYNKIKSDIHDFYKDYPYEEVTVSVGTNEEIEFFSYEDIFGDWSVDITELNQKEYEFLVDTFGDDYGLCSINAVHDAVMQKLYEINESKLEHQPDHIGRIQLNTPDDDGTE